MIPEQKADELIPVANNLGLISFIFELYGYYYIVMWENCKWQPPVKSTKLDLETNK